MIIGIDTTNFDKIKQVLRKLYFLRSTSRESEMQKLDYLDYFEYICLPYAVECLPTKTRKIYEAKSNDLLKRIETIRENAQNDPDTRRMYSNLRNIYKNYEVFVSGAFSGYESLDPEPINKLVEAEKNAIVARAILTRLKHLHDEGEME